MKHSAPGPDMVGMRRPDFPVLTWLGSRGRPALSADGVDAMLKRRGAEAGIAGLHPHAFRHTWAHAFRAAGVTRAT